MIAFPNCKINLGLHIVGKRADGYHDLETAFYPVPLTDAIEIIPSKDKDGSGIMFTQSGAPIAGEADDNLCIKAYQLIKERFPELPAVRMHLHKEIPTGAGLGGGSADAAFVLQLLNKNFKLGITSEELKVMALTLGSDCPYFLLNKPALAFGRGEILKEIPIQLTGWQLLLINPGIRISTAEAFKGVRPDAASYSLEEILLQPVNTWKGKLQNQFEETVFPQYPELEKIKERLYQAGAVYASMSGSGSTLYGLFSVDAKPPETLMKQQQFSKWYRL